MPVLSFPALIIIRVMPVQLIILLYLSRGTMQVNIVNGQVDGFPQRQNGSLPHVEQMDATIRGGINLRVHEEILMMRLQKIQNPFLADQIVMDINILPLLELFLMV